MPHRLFAGAIALLASTGLVLGGCRIAKPQAPPATARPEAAPATAPTETPRSAGEPQEPLSVSLPAEARTALRAPLEFDLATTEQAGNPFDPAEIDLVVHYIGPDGAQITVPAFWYQGYDLTAGTSRGKPGWKARFTPTQAGSWTAQAEIRNRGIQSSPITFQVAPSDRPGFVRVSPRNPRYLAFDDGRTFFPIGLNLGWARGNSLADYTRWLDRLQENGGSLIRVWMASWSFGIEWNDTGLGDYSARLRNAWQLDQVFRLAEERGIYVELVLLNHGAFSERTNPEWASNPYNAANGGPCLRPEAFANDPEARRYFQRRVRYIAARWGYSPNLLAWEWWNEVNWTPISVDALVPWLKEMTATIRQYDPYRHLVSTSYSSSVPPEVANLAEIDLAQFHQYDAADPLLQQPRLFARYAGSITAKPILFAEFGADAGGEDASSIDRQGLHLHNGLWAATFSGYASPAMYWWWDTLIDPLDLWGHFGSLSRFLEGEDMAVFSPGKAQISPLGASALTLQSAGRTLVWVRNSSYEVGSLRRAYEKVLRGGQLPGADWRYEPEPLAGLSLTLTGLPDGACRVHWYDPGQGRWLEETTAEVQGGTLTLPLPPLATDLALKVEPAG